MATFWERVKTGSKTGFDKTWKALDKVGAPTNRLSNRLGSEAFWPTTLDKECDKAARILKSFCKDGFYTEDEHQPQEGPRQNQKVIKKIPAEVIQNAKALAIFTTMRAGLWFSGAGGSGILIARKEDGSWSPPSGILLHTAGLGFMVGIDIYDCVVVINSEQALEAFYKVRCTLGSEISVTAGPVGAGGVLETEIHKRQAPIFTYMKSRGFYAGVQIDGTVIIERSDENERFYGQRIGVKDILGGQVRHPPFEINRLLETIKAAQGYSHDAAALPTEPPPGDHDIDDGHVFGVPDKEDPDPYGVLALEKEGMRVVEAGTQERASWEQFSFNPSPTSPVHNIYNRNSIEVRRPLSTRSSWRASVTSGQPTTPTRPSSLRQSVDLPKKSLMIDSSTQTDIVDEPLSPPIPGWRGNTSRRGSKASVATSTAQQMQGVPEETILEVDTTSKVTGYTTPPITPPLKKIEPNAPELAKIELDTVAVTPGKGVAAAAVGVVAAATPTANGNDENEDTNAEQDDAETFHDAEVIQPVMHSVQTIKPVATQVVSKARLVTVAKRVPPKLPPRNPRRANESPTGRVSEESSVSPLEASDLMLEPSKLQEQHSTLPPVSPIDHDPTAAKQEPIKTAISEQSLSPKLGNTELNGEEDTTKRLSTLSNQSNSSSTWDKVRAMRAIDDDD